MTGIDSLCQQKLMGVDQLYQQRLNETLGATSTAFQNILDEKMGKTPEVSEVGVQGGNTVGETQPQASNSQEVANAADSASAQNGTQSGIADMQKLMMQMMQMMVMSNSSALGGGESGSDSSGMMGMAQYMMMNNMLQAMKTQSETQTAGTGSAAVTEV